MKDRLTAIIRAFLADTEGTRTEYSEEHDIPSVREPTFQEFIDWLLQSYDPSI